MGTKTDVHETVTIPQGYYVGHAKKLTSASSTVFEMNDKMGFVFSNFQADTCVSSYSWTDSVTLATPTMTIRDSTSLTEVKSNLNLETATESKLYQGSINFTNLTPGGSICYMNNADNNLIDIDSVSDMTINGSELAKKDNMAWGTDVTITLAS